MAAGLYDRLEWEHEIDSDAPVLTGSKHPLAAAVGAKVIARIAPVFRSLIERTTASVALDGALIEVAVDQGEVDADARRTPVCEIELELKQGSSAALFALARQLDATAAVRLGVLTKAERGYRLLDRHDAQEAKAEPIALIPELPVTSAFQTIAWSCVRHFRLNETLLTDTGDAEALHQARVALRRLRSPPTVSVACGTGSSDVVPISSAPTMKAGTRHAWRQKSCATPASSSPPYTPAKRQICVSSSSGRHSTRCKVISVTSTTT